MAILMLKSAPKKAVKKAVKKVVKKTVKKAVKKTTKPKKTVSKVGRKHQVLSGAKAKTKGGLTASSLKKNKNGKVVSKKMSALGSTRKWPKAVVAARKALKIQGFCAVGGKSAQGKALLAKAREVYAKM